MTTEEWDDTHENKFKPGDTVYTDTHGVYQDTQESLSRLKGTVIDSKDRWNIHVQLEGKSWGPVGFSDFELSHEPIKEYKNETV